MTSCQQTQFDRPVRTRIFQSSLAAVDDLQSARGDSGAQPEGFSADFQVCLPYRGLLLWHVGGDDIVGDANQVLFVTGGEAFRVREPSHRGYGELIVTPDLPLLGELVHTQHARLSSHPLFVRRSRRANMTVQRLRARFVHEAARGNRDVLALEELLLHLLRCALEVEPQGVAPSISTRRLIRRTKLFLDAYSSSGLRLGDVARAVGASPAYLTNVFHRAEGIPIHKYLVHLRLARALLELPHANDLTVLALDLGFSSHSHFAAAFRRAFDCTPSDFRGLTRKSQKTRINGSLPPERKNVTAEM